MFTKLSQNFVSSILIFNSLVGLFESIATRLRIFKMAERFNKPFLKELLQLHFLKGFRLSDGRKSVHKTGIRW